MTDKNKLQLWSVAFLVLPLTFLSHLGDSFADNSVNSVLLTCVFGGFGGFVGGCLFLLVKTKTTLLKSISLLLLIGLCIATLIIVESLNKPTFETCQICGYKSIVPGENECRNCTNITWKEQQKITGFDNNQEWLKEEQLIWFSLDSLSQQIDFYKSDIDSAFEKDTTWKPIINKKN